MIPNVDGEEAYWGMKKKVLAEQALGDEPDYEAIETPLNNPTGVVVAFFATVIGFAMVWHIWWMAILGLGCAFGVFVVFAWRDSFEHETSADEVARIDRKHRRAIEDALARRGAQA